MRRVALLIVGFLGLVAAGRAPAQVRYVDAASNAAAPDGLSWATAFADLQSALAAADADPGIAEIWVAAGRYVPDEGPAAPGDPAAVFVLREGLALYGGFAGTETARTDRNPRLHRTVLSGDLDGDDLDPDGDGLVAHGDRRGRNSYHVVRAQGVGRSARLDGFAITGGQADGAGFPHNRGGGLLVLDASPTIANVAVAGNGAAVEGGGVYVYGASRPLFVSVALRGNQATLGGGLYDQGAGTELVNTLVAGNAAQLGGGLLSWVGAALRLVHTTVAGNRAAVDGGGLYHFAGSRAVLVNTIVWGNGAGRDGPESFRHADVYAAFQHSLIRGSVIQRLGRPIWNEALGLDQGGNLSFDPGFIDPADPAAAPTLSGDYRVLPGSPVLDAALDAADADAATDGLQPLPTDDLAGDARRQHAALDVGAFEGYRCPPGPVAFVDSTAAAPGDGESWATAFPKLQSALATARHCPAVAEVWIAEGTYYPDEGVGTRDDNRLHAFSVPDGLAVYGGFAGTETRREARDPVRHETILSGDNDQNDALTDVPQERDGLNADHVVLLSFSSPATLLDGLTIRRGVARASGGLNSGSRRHGGGLFLQNAAPTLRNLRILENSAWSHGAGLYSTGGHPLILNSTFAHNGRGSAIYADGGSATIVNTTFHHNEAYRGGALHLNDAEAHVVNCTFVMNTGSEGGALYVRGAAAPTITNSILWENQAPQVFFFQSTATFRHSLVQGSGGSAAWDAAFGRDGGGNLDADPLFHDPLTYDYRLAFGSPAVNAGDDEALPADLADLDDDRDRDEPLPLDGAGNARILHGRVDMGAFESMTPPTPTPTEAGPAIPTQLTLGAPFPNPFARHAVIPLAVPQAGRVRLVAYDVRGRAVAMLFDGTLPAGRHEVAWDAAALPAGLYLLRLEAGTARRTQHVVRLR